MRDKTVKEERTRAKAMVCYLVGHSQMQLITESHSSAFLEAIDTAPQDSPGRGGGRENHL